MACLATDRPADVHQSPQIYSTDTPGAPTGQGAGGWPPLDRCGTQARRPPGPEARRRLRRRRFAVANSLEVVVGAAVEGEASWVTHSDYPSALGVAGTCGELATAKRRRGSSEEAQESIRD
jgi:hypothetical protein